MEHLTTKTLKLIAVAAMIIALHSCYYDNVEDLYPSSSTCDTTNVTYTNSVKPVIDANCLSCHNDALANGNVSFSSYDKIAAVATSGKLLGVIRHDSNYPPMPLGADKLPDCTIKKIEVWVNAGAQNN